MKYARIISEFFGSCWAIQPEKFMAICEFLDAKGAGVIPPQLAAMRADVEDSTGPGVPVDAAVRGAGSVVTSGGIAVIPVLGTITQRANMLSDFSGGTSTDKLRAAISMALADDSIGSILLDIDSPGGSVAGTPEIADFIFKARERKPIVAHANSLAASAAFWIGTSASEFVMSPSADVGSIGVLTTHTDVSAADEAEGIKRTIISAGKFKVEGNPFEPLGEEALTAIQSRVNEFYGMFVAAVARGRGVKAGAVTEGMGEGRTVGASEALAQNMVDRVETMHETIERLSKPAARAKISNRRARLAVAERM